MVGTSSESDDELFRRWENEFGGERAIASFRELRELYASYMNEIGMKAATEKAEATIAALPGTDATTAAVIANIQVAADAILSAVAVHLARMQPP
jgi:hypothetical protein